MVRVVIILLALGVLVLEGYRPFLSFLDDVEAWHLTIVQRLVHQDRYNSGIDIVAVDDKTRATQEARNFLGQEPIKRSAFGYVIRFMNRAKAKYVMLDYQFVAGRDFRFPESDQLFADAITASTIPVASALFNELNPNSDYSIGRIPSSIQAQSLNITGDIRGIGHTTSNWTIPPLDFVLDTPMRFNSAKSLLADRSQTIRFHIPVDVLGGRVYPTVPMAMALNGNQALTIVPRQGVVINGRFIDYHGQPFPVIRWYGNANPSGQSTAHTKAQFGPLTQQLASWWQRWSPYKQQDAHHRHTVYPQYSIWDVVRTEIQLECNENPRLTACAHIKPVPPQDQVKPAWFKNRYVFVGKTATNSNADSHQSIYGVTHYPGVYIQANILDNYLHNEFVKPSPGYYPWVAAVFMALVAIIVCMRLPILYSVFIVLFLGSFYAWWSQWVYIHHNLWLNWTYPTLSLAISFVVAIILKYLSAEKRKQQLRYAFAKYVSAGVMQSIERNPRQISLGGQRKELTILFTDIRGFTAFSENNEPEVVQSCLTEYFSVMNGIILNEYQGSINKLIGDAIMAYWGFPVDTGDSAYLAVSAGLKMKTAMETWQSDPTKPPFKIGIGINTGDAVIGNVGSQDFMDFTVIGDAVNLASRLESLNKTYGTTMIISEATYLRVKDRVEARFLGEATVKGKEESVRIYEPLRLLDVT